MLVEGYTTFSCQYVKWLIREGIPTSVKGTVISDLSSSTFFEQNTPIKKGKRKSIWLYTLSSGETYIIKRYETRHFLAYIKNIIVASKAARELKAATTIARKGISTIVPAAVGEKSWRGLVKEGYVVFKLLEDCQDLNYYFLKESPTEKSDQNLAERRMIIKELGTLARKVLEEGILQSDFALNNFLLTKDETGGVKIYLSDFEKITIKRSLSFSQQVRCLAKLNRVGREISVTDRLRFLKSYCAGDDNGQRVSSLAKTIQKRTINLLKRDAARGRITSVYTDALYDKYQQADIGGYFRKGYKIKDIIDTIQKFDLLAKSLPTPDMKQREEINVVLSCEGSLQPLKVIRFINHAKDISARRLWIKMSTLAIAGIPLDIPHVFMEMRVKDNQEGYLFIPQRENGITLEAFFKPTLDKKELSFMIELLLKFMKKLHNFGTFSGRISEDDFTVVEKEGRRPSLYINNIEKFDIKNEVSLEEKKRELAVINALLKKHYPMMTLNLPQRYFKEPKTS